MLFQDTKKLQDKTNQGQLKQREERDKDLSKKKRWICKKNNLEHIQ